MSTTSGYPRLRFDGLKKAFDATVALDDVSFDVAPGEVHALLGANGAGKSTLIKILAGVYVTDAGQVLVDGGPAHGKVSFIHQDLGLVDSMTIAEAVAMSRGFKMKAGLIDWKEVRKQATLALARIGANLPVDALIGDLSRADRSIVAIARAITDECKVLVLDEPTASLPDKDVDTLFEIIASLKAKNISILYVTHRLDEVYRIADVVTVLRDGKLINTLPLSEVSRDALVKMIVGSSLPEKIKIGELTSNKDLLTLHGIRLTDIRSQDAIVNIKEGEILGLAGLRGSGQEQIGQGIAGVIDLQYESLDTGNGPIVNSKHSRNWLRSNVGYASSRRESEGLAMTLTVRENLFLNMSALGRKILSWNSPGAESKSAQAVANELKIRPRNPEVASGTLSGGNQQKVILGRLIATNSKVLVLEEPTMGVDVGARAEIYRIIAEAATKGRSFVVVSSDFEELPLICHRVLVIDRGVVAKELVGSEITTDAITHYCSGANTYEGVVA